MPGSQEAGKGKAPWRPAGAISLKGKQDPLADLVLSREVRLLLLGLHSLTSPTPPPAPPPKGTKAPVPVEQGSGLTGAARTAEKLLRCLHKVQVQLKRSRTQHQLLNLVHDTILSRQQKPEAPLSPSAETADIMKEVEAKTSFWQVIRCDYWRKRQPVPHGTEPEAPLAPRKSICDRRASTFDPLARTVKKPPRDFPESKRHKGGSSSSSASPVPQRRGFQNLKSFGHSSSTGQLPRAINPPAKLLSIEGAVTMLKDHGVWEDLGSPQARPLRALSTAVLPPISTSPKTENNQGEETSSPFPPPLTPTSVFPELAHRKPIAPRRLIFADCDSSGSTQKLQEVLQVPNPEPPSVIEVLSPTSSRSSSHRGSRLNSGQDFDPFSQFLEASSPGTGSNSFAKNVDPAFKHPPRWMRSKSVVEKLDPSGALKTMGPQTFPRVEVESVQFEKTPELAYVTAYEDCHLMPRVHRSVTNAMMEAKGSDDHDGRLHPGLAGPTHRLDMVNYGVGDAALKALSDSLKHLGRLESLNLAGNKLKGNRVAEFLRLQLPRHGSTLKELDLSGNRDLGSGAIEAITDLLHKGGLRVLQSLHLDSVIVPEELWEPLLHEITDSGSVRIFTAADTRFGFRSQVPFAALARLLTRGILERLDLAGNYLRHEGCEKLGQALAESDTLLDLDLSHNPGDPIDLSPAEKELKNPVVFCPLLHICEGLSRNTVLEKIALANCSLGYAADFLLGEAIARHPCLKFMDLSANTHGSLGLVCLLRAVGQPESKMQQLDISDARAGGSPAPAICYNWGDPTGKYAMHFVNPQHRAVMRALLARPTINGKSSMDCFKDVKAAGQERGWGIGNCSTLDYWGMATVPLKGTLSFTYSAPTPSSPRGDANPLAKMQNVGKLGKLPLRFARSNALLASYGTCRTDDQRSLFLDAVGNSFLLKNAHLDLFLRHSNPTLDLRRIIRSLIHAVIDGGALCTPTAVRPQVFSGAEIKVRTDAAQALFLNLRSPTGHHTLGLANPSDRACAEALQALCDFERRLHTAQGVPDISQFGNQEPVRNLRLGHELLSFSSFELPQSGILDFDYVSTSWPPRGASVPQPQAGLAAQVALALRNARPSWTETLSALRTVVDRLSLTADEVRLLAETAGKLPGQPSSKPAKIEAFVTCFGRCVERHKLTTATVMYDPALFNKEEAKQLQVRLGRVNVLDSQEIHEESVNLPDGNSFRLDLAVHEERVLASYLGEVAKRESPEFLTACSLTGIGTWKADMINSGSFPPSAGTFSCKYVVADPQLISKAGRKELAQKVLGLVV